MVTHHLQLNFATSGVSEGKAFLVKMLLLSGQHLKSMSSVVRVGRSANLQRTLFVINSRLIERALYC